MQEIKLIVTGVRNLDAVLGGGIPAYSMNIIAGRPGTGKTILAQQIIFNHIAGKNEVRALYLTTLSEPTIKVLRYMQHFIFFNPEAFGESVIFQDIGTFIREHPLPEVADYIMRLVEEHRPEILVIDSFKAIHDLAKDAGAFRRFCYDLSVVLVSERCTTLLVGEYDRNYVAEGTEFAIADGILYLDVNSGEGEQRRFFQALKMRGRAAEMAPFPFVITSQGIDVLSPSLTLRRRVTGLQVEEEHLPTGVPGLDALMRGGILRGRTVLVSGVSGTGKTTFALHFLVHGAKLGEKGLLFSFEETPDRLRRMAGGFGWDLGELEDMGLIKIIFIPQTDIRVEEHLELMVQEVRKFQPRRFVVDSFSVFLHKTRDPAVQREKTFQLATLMQCEGSVGLLISDIAADQADRLSRFGVEETVLDGTIVLSSEIAGLKRRRYIEVYKLRSTNHVPGRHRFEITGRGLEVLYLAPEESSKAANPPRLLFKPLEAIEPAGVRYGSAWLAEGEQGAGKSTLAYQFASESLRNSEAVLLIATDAPSYQVQHDLETWGCPVRPSLQSGHLRILDTYPASGEDYLDLTDTDSFFYKLERNLRSMPHPCRLVTDSLTPIAVQFSPAGFVAFVERKNHLLYRPDVAIFDTLLLKTLDESIRYSLFNSYDVVLCAYSPDWGEMSLRGQGARVFQVRKVRGVKVDNRPYPYAIRPGEGMVVQGGFYD